jgi:iron-sulfur cluster repair protein YtfE (RIC family)
MNPAIDATIKANTKLLDVVSKWPATEAVFRRYDDKAGVCLCCSCLFDTLEEIAKKHSLDLNNIMREINNVAVRIKSNE